jgi:hypothetical protein
MGAPASVHSVTLTKLYRRAVRFKAMMHDINNMIAIPQARVWQAVSAAKHMLFTYILTHLDQDSVTPNIQVITKLIR